MATPSNQRQANQANTHFKFRRHATVGSAAAEDDVNFLSDCFINTGDINTILDCANPKRIVVGRTGTGKTALLNEILKHENTISIYPENLSFQHISNSTVLNFFLELGVSLDLFFKLLWRHVFTVELIKRRYSIINEKASMTFLDKISEIVTKNSSKRKAIQYLQQWGDKFWEETDYRIKEVTSKFEEQLKDSISLKPNNIGIEALQGETLTTEEKYQISQRGQNIVNQIQIKELSNVLDFLNEDVFSDPKRRFYICIDKLDENWVDDKFRFLLIRSLIETIRDFQRVGNVKIIIALRTDLLDRVIRITRDNSFQEEKYRSLILKLKWSGEQLRELLDKRVNFLVKQSYTSRPVFAKDLLPSKVFQNVSGLDYMIDRTLMRPRELIEFFNICIEQCEGKPKISKDSLLHAEGQFSKDRMRSLQDEWYADYQRLIETTRILKKKPYQFRISSIDQNEVEEFCLELAYENIGNQDQIIQFCNNVCNGIYSPEQFLCFIFHVFHRVGIVGIKTETYDSFQWSFNDPITISPSTITPNSIIKIHPMFWRFLGIRPPS